MSVTEGRHMFQARRLTNAEHGAKERTAIVNWETEPEPPPPAA